MLSPSEPSGGQLLVHLISRVYEPDLDHHDGQRGFGKWLAVFGHPKMTTALLNRLQALAAAFYSGAPRLHASCVELGLPEGSTTRKG